MGMEQHLGVHCAQTLVNYELQPEGRMKMDSLPRVRGIWEGFFGFSCCVGCDPSTPGTAGARAPCAPCLILLV